MKTKENKKNWILSDVILVLFVITQYMLRSGIYLMINGKQPVSCGHYLSGPCHVL